MKKVAAIVAAAASMVVVVLVAPSIAKAGSEWARVTINPQALWEGDIQVNVGARVECKTDSGVGQLEVNVIQSPPESTVQTNGDGTKTVICDGVAREVSVDVTADVGFQFDVGRARATATLVSVDVTLQPTSLVLAEERDRDIFLRLR